MSERPRVCGTRFAPDSGWLRRSKVWLRCLRDGSCWGQPSPFWRWRSGSLSRLLRQREMQTARISAELIDAHVGSLRRDI